MDPLTAATSVAGLLSLAIQVSQILYDQIRTVKNAPKDAQDLLDEFQLLRQVLTSLEVFLKAQALKGHLFKETSVLVSAVRGCGDKIIAVKLRLERLVRNQGIAQIIERGKWYYDHDEHQALVTSLHRYLGMFQISLNVDGIELLSKSADDVTQEIMGLKSAISALTPDPEQAQAKSKQLDDILQLLSPISFNTQDVTHVSERIRRWDLRWQDQESQDILNWLSPLNFWTRQDDTLSRKEEGTARWIFEEPAFNAWLKGTERILWCPGMPGAGKTIITSAVIDYLMHEIHEQETAIAFIYCNYKEKEDQTTVNLVASLLQQLVQRQPVIPSQLRLLYEQHIRKKTRPTLAECSELLHMELTTCPRAFIIVGALDECDETSGARRDLISQLLRLPPSTYMMVTSRGVPSIKHELNRFSRLEIHASDADVRTYLEGRIEREGRLKRHVQADLTLRNTILDTIVKKVRGMFLLAQLHIESLAKKHTRKAVRKALENLPKGLDETYDEAMQRIYNQDEDDVQLAKKLLLWVSYSLRPLTVRELQHALAVELDDRATDEEALLDKTLMISVCAGIMTIDQESNVIRLVHYTTEDYFQRKRLDEFPTGQTSIAMTCLTYLSFDAFKVGYASDDEQMEARLKEYPLLQYAAQYWGIHATARAEPILQSQILKFLTLESNLSCSVQAMQLPSYRYNFYSQESAEWIPGLWVAAVFGLTEIVKALITPKTSLDMKTSHGETALYGAAAAGHEAVVRVLLENGADVNAEDKYNETALYGTAAAGHEAMVRVLLENGADVNAEDKYGRTALHGAAAAGHKAVVRVLLENGAEVNAGHKYNWTALHRAAAAGHEAVVRVLLENGIKVNVEYKYNWTALHGAAAAGYKAVVQVLLENGAEVNAKDEYRRTALHGAAAAGHETVVRMLLENGAEGNAKDEYGKRALYGAAAAEHEAVVRVLLKNGADVNAEDKYGRTALHGAAAAGHKGGGAGIARKRGGG